ncbi:MAG: DMT family transporter, partial [Algicola sp.]|nr:DMT family transporter [Algicola sp.]
ATSGLTLAPSAHFGIIAPSSMLVFVTLGGFLWLKESLKPSRVLGILLILSGVVFVAGHSLGNISTDTLMGDLMFVGCGLLWASYTLLAKHWQISPWTATAMVAVVSMVIYLPVYLIGFDSQQLLASVDTLMWQGLFQGVLTAIAALYFYSKAVALLGSGKGAVFSALVPPIALLLGALLLGETITWVEYAGLGLVCFGMLFALEVVRLPRFWAFGLPKLSV